MNFNLDDQFIQQTLSNLVQINSSNPLLTAGAPGEAEISRYLAQLMTGLGLTVSVFEAEPGRPSVVGVLPGMGHGKSLMLNGHTDTVGLAGMDSPLSGEIKDGRLYGRGSQDMKSGVTAMIAAAKALIDANISLAGDLIIAAVADEEYASIGTDEILQHFTADAAIVTEPTDMALCLAHRGFTWFQVDTIGRAAHGSRYRDGIDANMRMGRFLAELDKLEQALRQRPGHPLAGKPSLHASLLQGGTEISVYAARCQLHVERRTCPGETEAQTTGELQQIIDRLVAADPTFKATVKQIFGRGAFEVDPGADIVQTASAVMANRLGQRPTPQGATYWTDAALLAAAGIDTIILGPTGHGLHSSQEWVELQSVVDLAGILAETAIRFCR
jgi:acetylornithine deacetylase